MTSNIGANGLAARPGSTRRQGSALGGVPPLRPGSRANIRVPDRPVTQQGLTGMKTAAKGLGPERSVQDRTYYLGLLRGKIQELSLEKGRINRELDAYQEDNANYLLYEQRAQQLATEISGLRGDMGDYNLLMERVGTGSGIEEVEQESEAVRMENRRESMILEQVFSERQRKEEEVRAVEQQMIAEREQRERVVELLEESDQDKYRELRREIDQLQQSVEQQEEQLHKAKRLAHRYEEEIHSSDVKTEAVRLMTQLRELESKRSDLRREAEERSVLSPEEEREKLLRRVKEDNHEITRLQERLTQTQEQVQSVQGDISQVERDIEDANSDKHQKYQEMKKKEADMKQFMDGYEDAWSSETQKRSEIEQNILEHLKGISKQLASSAHLPTVEEYEQLQADLKHKRFEKDKSEATAKTLGLDNARLQADLEKVNQLEGKLTSELDELKGKIGVLISETEKFSDLPALEKSETEKRARLGEEREILTKQRAHFKNLVTRTTENYEAAKLLLQDNETYVQLCNLERKWQHHLQSNFAMEEFIANKTKETDYQPIAKNVCLQLRKYNSKLIKSIQGVGK